MGLRSVLCTPLVPAEVASHSYKYSITFLELVLIIIAGPVWGKHWKGTHVCCRCNNQATVTVIQSRYSRDDSLTHLLHCLFFIEATFNFSLLTAYLPGRHNDLADALSHNKLSSSLLQANSMDQQPTTVHAEISHLLLDTQVDWLSETWTALFNSILSRV